MSSLIIRIYDNYGDALDAANELGKNRFGSRAITLISNARNREPDEPPDAAALERAGIPHADVAAFTSEIAQGKSVLAVRAVFGAAAKAIKVMRRHKPIYAGIGWKEYNMTNTDNTTKSDSSAPLSSALGWPLLLSDAAPLSRFFKWPTLLNNPTPLSSWFKFPTLLGGSRTFTFGEPKLRGSRDFTFGEPKLRGSSAFTFGEPKLQGSNAYTFGEPKLRSSGTEFSSALNLPVLADEPKEKAP